MEAAQGFFQGDLSPHGHAVLAHLFSPCTAGSSTKQASMGGAHSLAAQATPARSPPIYGPCTLGCAAAGLARCTVLRAVLGVVGGGAVEIFRYLLVTRSKQ